mmetsp:Transcript_24048/g.48076  ORF Transcript_24048/g.48076 Transcript_24048/m.48076 type:complete len:110 (-) Transcript_24048:118-447(-)
MRCQKMNNLCRCPPLPQPSDHPWRQVNGMRIRQYFERHADKRNLTVRGLAFTLGMRQGVKGGAAKDTALNKAAKEMARLSEVERAAVDAREQPVSLSAWLRGAGTHMFA